MTDHDPKARSSGGRLRLTAGYQGAPGAYGESAVTQFWGGGVHGVPIASFAMLVRAVADGSVDFAVIPVWNSTIGAISEASDALRAAEASLERIDEVLVPIRHAVLALPGATVESLRAVGSHRAAIEQCRGFFAAHPAIAAVVAWDTAGAAEELASLATPAAGARPRTWFTDIPTAAPESLGAITNPAIAERLGLRVLAEGIQDKPDNATRFSIVRARAGAPAW